MRPYLVENGESEVDGLCRVLFFVKRPFFLAAGTSHGRTIPEVTWKLNLSLGGTSIERLTRDSHSPILLDWLEPVAIRWSELK